MKLCALAGGKTSELIAFVRPFSQLILPTILLAIGIPAHPLCFDIPQPML
jgi:hypothetical protein